MSDFDWFISELKGYATTEQVGLESIVRWCNGIASFVQEHEDAIARVSVEDIAAEAANYSPSSPYPVFIILSKGHTPISKIIYAATHDEHSHASIAFDISLKDIYSFGTKKIDPKREMGFIHTSYDSDVWGDIPTEFDMYVTFVNKTKRDKMMKALKYFTEHADELKYHWGGLVRIFFHQKTANEKKWICSRFVAAILGEGIELDRDASLYRPSQLRDIQNVEYLISGSNIHDYDVREAKKALEELKNQGMR